jgi:DNA-binding transcriptional MerR regulator
VNKADRYLFQAQEFAERAGVTVRTLHHYDRLGLLKPESYTPAGYRLFGEASLARLQQISMLKFIGLPLKQIRDVLNHKPLDLRATLRLQREAIEQRRHQLEQAIAAINEAERVMSSSEEPDWAAFRRIIEVINMQNDMEWVKRYYSEEQLQSLAARQTPQEVIEQGQRDWAELISDIEAALGEDPASEKAQELAKRWSALIEQFTLGDAGIQKSLNKLYADKENWPSSFQKPYSDEVGAFICKATEILNNKKRSGAD